MKITQEDRKASNSAAGFKKLKTVNKRKRADETKGFCSTLSQRHPLPWHSCSIYRGRTIRLFVVSNCKEEMKFLRRYKLPRLEKANFARDETRSLQLRSLGKDRPRIFNVEGGNTHET